MRFCKSGLYALLSVITLVASALAVLVPVNVAEVKAATITVDTLTDITNGSDGLTTLREAITAATTGDIIEFSSSLFTNGPRTLEITDYMSVCCKGLFEIRGPGRDNLTIKGPKSDRTITGYSISNNVMTVTLSSAPAFSANIGGLQGRVLIYGTTAPITGEHVVTGVSGNTFTVAKTAADVPFTAASGTAASPLVSSSTHWGLAGRFMDVTSSVKVTGLTVEGFLAERGGAFHVKSGATLYLDNVRVKNTAAFDWYNCGGAIKADRGHLDIRNTIFDSNIGKCDGAINMGDGNGTTMYIGNSTFTNNISENGWAITSYLPAEIVNTTISGTKNYAGSTVSAFNMSGIAMPLTISGSTFSGAGAVYISNASASNISNSTFTTTSGTAALRLAHTYSTLTGNTIESCTNEYETGINSSSGNTFTNPSTCDTASAPNGAKVTTYSRASNVVTMNTATGHGFAVGDTVRLCGLQAYSTSCGYTTTVASVPSSTSFTFAQTASDLGSTNAVGEAARSVWVFEPRAVAPGAPTITSVTAGNAQVVLAWSAGSSGTSSISDYVIQSSRNNGSWTTYNDGVGTSTNRTITGLVNGDSYEFRVAAVSSVGTSSYSSASTAVTPTSVSTTTTSTTTPSSSTTTPPSSSSTVAPSSSVPSSTSPSTSDTVVVSSDNDGEEGGETTRRSGATQSSTTTTSTTTTTTTIPAPDAPEVDPGSAAAIVNGQSVTGTVSRLNNTLVVEVGGINAVISGISRDGSVVALDEDGNLRLEEGDLISVEASGFSSGSGVELWVFSTPFRLADVTAGSDGRVSGTYPLPASVEPGSHRVVLKGQNSAGSDVVAGVGLYIGEPFNADGVSPWVIWTPVSLAIAFALIIPATRRRRKQREVVTTA
jgi:hypothetical protein